MTKKTTKKPKPDRTYKTTVTYTCPVRGLVTEEIEVKRFEGDEPPDNAQKWNDWLAAQEKLDN